MDKKSKYKNEIFFFLLFLLLPIFHSKVNNNNNNRFFYFFFVNDKFDCQESEKSSFTFFFILFIFVCEKMWHDDKFFIIGNDDCRIEWVREIKRVCEWVKKNFNLNDGGKLRILLVLNDEMRYLRWGIHGNIIRIIVKCFYLDFTWNRVDILRFIIWVAWMKNVVKFV